MIERTQSERLVGRLIRDSTAIHGREKPSRKRPAKRRRCDGRHKEYWSGYKLPMDLIDGNIPIRCVLSSASLNDNQVAIPLAEMSAQRVTSCYELMDAGYDCEAIGEHSRKLGHVPIIRRQKHGAQEVVMDPHQMARYRDRTTIERVFGRLKEGFGFSTVRVRGAYKVMAHLMFGVLALTADQLSWCAGEGSVAGVPG